MAYDGALKFDTKVDQSGFVGGISQLKSTAMAAIGAIGGAFATGAIAKALIGQIGLVEQYGSAINDQSQKIGITTQAYQELNYIMGQVGGNVDMLQMGIKTLSSAVVDGNKAFEQLGISLDEARAMSQEDLFNKVVEQLASMESGTLRTSLATDLFGRSASELAPLLNMGADGIAKMRQEAQNYGLVMTEEAVAATDRFGDAQTLAQKSGEALRNAMIGKMMPALTDIALGFADIAKVSTEAFNARGISGVVDVITDRFPVATAAVAGLTSAFVALLIINSVNAAVASFTATENLLTLATKYGTLAQWNELGALTAKQIVVAALTGKVGLATAAQWLWNAAISANPVMILVTAIGILVGSLVILNKHYESLHPEITQAIDDVDALSKSVSESKNAFKDSTDEIESNRRGTLAMIDALSQMSSEYTGTAIEQRKMQSIVDELNGAIEGLSLSFNSQTGKLSTNTEALKTMTEAQYEAAKGAAELSRYTRLLEEQADAEYALSRARKAFYSMGEGSGATATERLKANKAVREAQSAYNDVSAEILDLNEQLAENAAVTDASTMSLGLLKEAERGLAEETERIVIGGYDVTDVLDEIGMTADDVAARLDNFTAAATNMFDRISTESKLKVSEMVGNLEFNATALQDWSDNIVYLGSKLPTDLLQPLIDQGPADMAGVLNELAGASDTELANLTAAFENGGENAKDAWLQSLGAGLKEENPLLGVLDGAEEAATESGTQFGKSLITAINQQDYSGATSSLNNAFKRTFDDVGNAFHVFLDRFHFDLAYAIGGVRIDLAAMAYEVRSALAKIPTLITIRVNVIYSSSGGVSGASSPTMSDILSGRASSVYAPITVRGVVQSDTQLAGQITKNFEEVVYGRNS